MGKLEIKQETAMAMLEELEYLVEDCIEFKELRHSDGTSYWEERIYAYKHTIDRIRELIAKARGKHG